MGNITAITDQNNQATQFVYDSLYRLITADYPGNENDLTYTYDAVGNRKTQTRNGETKAYNYSLGNRLLSIHQNDLNGPILAKYSYDHNGSRTEWRDGNNQLKQSYSYDQKYHITTLTTDNKMHQYQYDPNNYRIENQTDALHNKYLLEAEHLEAIYGQDNKPKSTYLRGVIVDEIVNGYTYDDQQNKTNITYHHDHLNSVTALTGHEGSTIQTLTYGPFGEILEKQGNDPNTLNYTGREQDQTGLYYYRARYYDPEAGRFLTEDPLGFQAGINFYVYVDNNPINANDPSGNYTFSLGINFTGGGVLGGTEGINLVFDTQGNFAIQNVIGGGAFLGYGGSVSANLEFTNAKSFAQLNGLGGQTIASLGEGIVFELGITGGDSKGLFANDPSVKGISLGAGLGGGTPVQITAFQTQTDTKFKINFFDGFNQLKDYAYEKFTNVFNIQENYNFQQEITGYGSKYSSNSNNINFSNIYCTSSCM